MDVGPVFLLASERSGTNLLRRRLTQWQSVIYGPSPSHILKHIDGRTPYYGDLSDDRNFRELISDALSLCYDHFSPWDIRLDVENVLRGYDDDHPDHRTLILLLDWLHRTYARSKGYETYLCKDNNLFDCAFQLKHELPDARFIYLHRDPRDFTLSQINRPLGNGSVTRSAKLWRDQQTKCIRLVSDARLAESCRRIAYEDLIRDERACLRAVCEFLGVEMNEAATATNGMDQGTCADWRNLDKPTMRGNFQKYRGRMSPATVRAIEAITWTQMRHLGYETESPRRPTLSRYYEYFEPVLSKSYELVRRPLALRRDPPGRSRRIATLRRIRAKFS